MDNMEVDQGTEGISPKISEFIGSLQLNSLKSLDLNIYPPHRNPQFPSISLNCKHLMGSKEEVKEILHEVWQKSPNLEKLELRTYVYNFEGDSHVEYILNLLSDLHKADPKLISSLLIDEEIIKYPKISASLIAQWAKSLICLEFECGGKKWAYQPLIQSLAKCQGLKKLALRDFDQKSRVLAAFLGVVQESLKNLEFLDIDNWSRGRKWQFSKTHVKTVTDSLKSVYTRAKEGTFTLKLSALDFAKISENGGRFPAVTELQLTLGIPGEDVNGDFLKFCFHVFPRLQKCSLEVTENFVGYCYPEWAWKFPQIVNSFLEQFWRSYDKKKKILDFTLDRRASYPRLSESQILSFIQVAVYAHVGVEPEGGDGSDMKGLIKTGPSAWDFVKDESLKFIYGDAECTIRFVGQEN